MLDLAGDWRAAIADETLRRAFTLPRTNDDDWVPITVPGHWRSTDAFAGTDGPVLYRHQFAAGAAPAAQRAWLVFDGIFYLGDIWLDGAYLGTTEGYFNRHTFEITAQLAARSEHLLAVEVGCPPGSDRSLTGAFQRDDPSWNPGGIWRGVRLEHTGPVRARDLRVVCRDATEEQAVLLMRAELLSDAARTVSLRTSLAGHEAADSTERSIAEGSNFVEWTLTVPRPDRWWPHALGRQPLHDLTVEVDAEGTTSHILTRRIGLRSVTRKDRILAVNGERLFLKGTTSGPARPDLAAAEPQDLRDHVEGLRLAGFDLLRLRAHITRPEVYDAADELGLLLWQDLPLSGPYARGVRKQAARQAGAAVDLLGHHPSIAIWCAHEWPNRGANLLEGTAVRALEKADGTRPVASRAAAGRESRDVLRLGRVMPRAVRFLTGVDRRQAESLRRLKYRPSGGFCLAPGTDPEGVAQPVVVAADPLPDAVAPGDTLTLDVHVVSDRRQRLAGAVVEATLTWTGGDRSWRWQGDVPADGCARVGTAQLVVPDAPGPLSFALRLTANDVAVTNRYESVISA